MIFRKTISYIFTLIILGFIVLYLVHNWESVSSVRWWESPGFLSIHIALLVLTFILFVISWHRLLILTGNTVDMKTACFSWLVSNAGKYLPGKVFMVAGRMALLNRVGIRKASAAGYIIWEHVILILAAMPFSLFILLNYSGELSKKIIITMITLLAFILIVVFNPKIIQKMINILLKTFKKSPLDLALKRKTILNLFIFYVLLWIVYGFSGISLAYALGMDEKVPLLLLFNIYIFSWLIGFISMITPGGIGIREGVLILMIRQYVPVSELMVFALLARMTWIITELFGVILGFMLGNRLNNQVSKE